MRIWKTCLFTYFFIFLLTPAYLFADEPWDLKWLFDIDPHSLTDQDLLNRANTLEEEYQLYHQRFGILWPARYTKAEDINPTHFDNGGDTALFTGFYLAAATYRFMVTRKESDLDKVLETLRGIHILTHISGVPGVLARNAFPKSESEKWFYPEDWQGRIEKGFVYESSDKIHDTLDPEKFYPKMIFYTRTSGDQLTGVLFGLGIALSNLVKPELKDLSFQVKITNAQLVIDEIGENLYRRIRSQDFNIRDHQGKTGSASGVSGILKAALLAFYKEVLRARGPAFAKQYERAKAKYKEQFRKAMVIDGIENTIQKAFGKYYGWNLIASRAFTIWTLDPSTKRRKELKQFYDKRIWPYIKYDQNTHFIFMYNIMRTGLPKRLDMGILSLKRFYFKPMRSYSTPLYNKKNVPSFLELFFNIDQEYVIPSHLRRFSRFFTWVKEPYSVGEPLDKIGKYRSPGLSYLLPYWMGRYYGLFSK